VIEALRWLRDDSLKAELLGRSKQPLSIFANVGDVAYAITAL
jgi:hypothetical protein